MLKKSYVIIMPLVFETHFTLDCNVIDLLSEIRKDEIRPNVHTLINLV